MVLIKGSASGLYLTANCRNWYILDARNQTFGRLASFLSNVLQGKTRAIYHKARDDGDYVVVTNCAHIHFVGTKFATKLYHHYTGMPGGLMTRNVPQVAAKDPCTLIFRTVYGMLPRNSLRNKCLDRLYLFPYDDHPFIASELTPIHPPTSFPPRLSQLSSEVIRDYPMIIKHRIKNKKT